jgi:hypothetical protein
MSEAERKKAPENDETASVHVEVVPEESSWGSWFGKAALNVVRVVEDSTNKLGSSIQKFVEEEIGDVDEEDKKDEEQPTNETQQHAEQQSQESQQGNKTSMLEAAEKSVLSFFDNVLEKGKHIVNDTEEFSYVKNVASGITKSTKNVTLNVYDQLAGGVKGAVLYLFADDNEENDHSSIKIYVSFKELFIEYDGLNRVHAIEKFSKSSETKLEKILSELSSEDRTKFEEIFTKIDALLDTSQFSTLDAKDIKINESLLTSQNAKELLATTADGEKVASMLIDNFNDISSTPIGGDDLFTTTLMLTEKSKAEGYRSLAKIAALATLHLLNLAEQVEANEIGKVQIPKEWLPENATQESVSYERIGELVRDYLTFVMKQLVTIGQTFSGTTQRINALLTKKIQPTVVTEDGTPTEIPEKSKALKEELDEKTVGICTQIIMQADKALSILLGVDKAINPILRYSAIRKSE